MSTATPTHETTTAASEAPRCPTDFRLFDALERPQTTRIRKLFKALLRFDPVPEPHVVDAFLRDMWTGDPVAEAFVDEVFFGPAGPRAGRGLLDRAMAEGIDALEDVPPSMQTLFAQFEDVPDWVDRDLVEQGAAIWRRWGTDLFRVAGAETLEMYTESAVAVPLSLAGGYAGDNALRRFLETTRFWMDVSEPGALFETGSAARTTAMRVRVMHVSVRRRVAEHEEWDAERWGLPISQAYMMLTLMGGSVAPSLIMWGLGYQTTPTEMRALLHHQRYLGHILGVHPRWYPSSIKEGLQIVFLSALGRSYTAGPHGAELIESFPKAFAPRKDMPLRRRLAAHYEHQLVCGYIAMLMAPNTRMRHDMPRVLPSLLLPLARLPLITAKELVRRTVPGADALFDRRARARRERWYRVQMDGREAAFDASSGLRR
jgi:hypothetical protein